MSLLWHESDRIGTVFIDNLGVNKSYIYTQLETGKWKKDHIANVGSSLIILTTSGSNRRKCKIGLWDTAGQERDKTIVPNITPRFTDD
jgi:GTPase SAR1 family protein